jgi:hypothetical protein
VRKTLVHATFEQALKRLESVIIFLSEYIPLSNLTISGYRGVIGCVTAMKIRLRILLRTQRAQADAVASYANSMKGVTCDTSAS